MSKMGDHVIKLQETPAMMECGVCGGSGEYEVDVPRPQGFGRDVGYLDSEVVRCEECSGDGEVVRPCIGCGEAMSRWDEMQGSVCEDCRNEDY